MLRFLNEFFGFDKGNSQFFCILNTVEPRYSAIEGTEKNRIKSRSILKVFLLKGPKIFRTTSRFALYRGSTVQIFLNTKLWFFYQKVRPKKHWNKKFKKEFLIIMWM